MAKNSSLPWMTCHSDFHADAAQQRHVGREELGDATAVGGGAEMEDPGTTQRLGGLADLSDGLRADDVGVLVELLLEKRDALEHSRPI